MTTQQLNDNIAPTWPTQRFDPMMQQSIQTPSHLAMQCWQQSTATAPLQNGEQRQQTAPSASSTPRNNRPMVSLSDMHAMVAPFTGTNKNQQADVWIDQFNSYTDFKEIDDEVKLRLFKLVLRDNAASWFTTLPVHTKSNLTDVLKAFRTRYGMSNLQMGKETRDLWTRRQKPNEKADDFVTDMRLGATRVGMPDNQLEKAILQGFHPETKKLVMAARVTDIEGMLEIARGCEAADASEKDNKTTSDGQVIYIQASTTTDNKEVQQADVRINNYKGNNYKPGFVHPNARNRQMTAAQTSNQQILQSTSPPQHQTSEWTMAAAQPHQTIERHQQQPTMDWTMAQSAPPRSSYGQPQQQPTMDWTTAQSAPPRSSYGIPQQQPIVDWTTSQSTSPTAASDNRQQQATQHADPTATQGQPTINYRPEFSGPCKYCLSSHPRGKQYCLAAFVCCNYCKRIGHIAAACFKAKYGVKVMASQ